MSTAARPLDGAVDEATSRAPAQRAQLGRATLVYGLGMVLSRASSVIMLPLYTRLLTPDDYGLLQLLDMTIDVVSILVSAGCTMGLMRFYFKTEDARERRAVVASAVLLQLGLNVVGALMLVAAAGPVWRELLHGAGSRSFVYLAAANFTLGSLSTVPLLVMQIMQRPVLFSIVSLGKLLLQLSLNVFLLVALRLGPLAILLSSGISGLLVGGLSLAWLIHVSGLRVSRRAMTSLWRFGLPYQLVTAGTFILNFGDRFFLSRSWGLAVVGLYGLAYQFGFLAQQVGYAPFARAWEPLRFQQAAAPRAIRDAQYREGFLFMNLLLITTVVGIALYVHPVLRLVSSPAFLPAATVVPLVLAAFVMQAWAGVMQFGIDVSERTIFSTYATWGSVVLILVLYAWLVPPMGAMGAALATFLAFVVRAGLFYGFAQRLWPVDYGWAPVLRLVVIGAATASTTLVVRPLSLVGEFASATALCVVYGAAVWLAVLDADQRATLRSYAAAQFSRFSPGVARA